MGSIEMRYKNAQIAIIELRVEYLPVCFWV